MTTRTLPFNEWSRLTGTEAEAALPYLQQDKTSIVVVEDGDTIVGCHILMWVLHAECLWIHPDHRGRSSVGRRLWSKVRELARSFGVVSMMTAACDDRVRGLLAHVGATKLDADHYVLPVRG